MTTAAVPKATIRVLGIDPGTRLMGWGVVERNGTRITHIAHGVIRAREQLSLAERLVIIERELDAVVHAHSVHSASIESLFFHKDAQAAAKLGHARGVALLVCARAGLEVFEYPPARVKRSIAGNGRAEKAQVAQMVRAMLRLPEVPQADAADALAISMTHLQRAPFLSQALNQARSQIQDRQPLQAVVNPVRQKRVKLA